MRRVTGLDRMYRTNADTIAARPGSEIYAGLDADLPTTDHGDETA